jgi:hypothetical protein
METFAQGLENLALGIIDAPWARFLYAVRWLFIFLDIVVIIAFAFVFRKALEYRPKFTFRYRRKKKESPFDTKVFVRRWEHIGKSAPKSPPQSYILAIIEADKLVDDALKVLGLGGEHMADRLEKLRVEDYPTLDRLWRAHRVRNELVHTPDFDINPSDAEDTLEAYEKFLKELGALPE